LREIAQNSEFTHGVLHYYFTDKVDLISECVRVYHRLVVARFDEGLETYEDLDTMVVGVAETLRRTITEETAQHRLWYDLRSHSMFNEEIREDVREIDRTLEGFAWRVVLRYAELTGTEPVVDSQTNYRMFDGIFYAALLDHMAGDAEATNRLVEQAGWLMDRICPQR
jgi:TetR/AcrR family transcriptional regulator, transcriptional repressor of bet genes